MRSLLLAFLLLSIIFTAEAQPPCSGPGRLPTTAQAVCGNLTFTQQFVSPCTGQLIPNPTAGCGNIVSTDNSLWYKFHCYQAGTFGFLLAPGNASDDYDWEIMDVTGYLPTDVYTTELRVSLNLSGQSGATGCTSAGISDINCAGGSPGTQFNRILNLVEGHDYLMMVNNWTNSGLGYTLDFSGTAVLTDNASPTITDISIVSCDASKLKVTFSEDILCNSITAAGTEFTVTSGTHVITGIVSDCSIGANAVPWVIINLQAALAAGNYQLTVNDGSDGNTFENICRRLMIPASVPFVIVQTSTPPVIQSFGYDECNHRDRIILNFDKPVACASLTATGSEFSFTPAGPMITGISSNCGSAAYTSQITLFLQNSLGAQSVDVNVNNGTDGNTLSDTCFYFIPQGYSKLFTATLPPQPFFDSVQIDNCNPTFVKAFFNHPIKCSSINPNGSQFTLATPAPVNIVSATGDITCAQGSTNWILLQFSSPILTAGNYRLVALNQAPVSDTCNMPQKVLDSISFNMLGKPSAIFNSQVNWGCVEDTIVFTHPGGNGINSWRWNFSDGTSATGQTVSPKFPLATPTVDVQLIVTNGTCIDTTTQTITLGNVFNAGFLSNPVDTFCINTPVNFTAASSGNISGYLWDFGDFTQFNGQNPPTHFYSVYNNYPVQLIVTDNHGCTDTANKMLFVTASPVIDFTGLKSQYCTGNQLVLTRKITRNINSYVWDNGDGKIFTNEVEVNFSYAQEGVYIITLTGNDRFCGTAKVSKTVPVYAVPKVSLGADTVLCPSERILIGVLPINNYTYLWSTGANTPQIYSDIFSRGYMLTADNHGCRGMDAMSIKVLPACLIKVPGAFTPNGDGLNDKLNAVNADLAKNFSFKIFNRVGQLMFSTNNPLDGWDGIFKGNRQETGGFVWILSYIDPWSGKPVKEKGTSILLR